MKENLLRLFLICVMSVFTLGMSAQVPAGTINVKVMLPSGKQAMVNISQQSKVEDLKSLIEAKCLISSKVQILYYDGNKLDGQKTLKECYVLNNSVLQLELTYLCFTANTAGTTLKLNKYGTPTEIVIESSTDGITWNTYEFGNSITLSNIGNKVYFRNNADITTGFSTSEDNKYRFVMTGSIAASGNIMSLIDKTCGSLIIPTNYCFADLFYECNSLTTAPELPATTLTAHCYENMFYRCLNLKKALSDYCVANGIY